MHTWIQNGKWMVKHRWVKQRKWKELWSKAEDISFDCFEDGFSLSIVGWDISIFPWRLLQHGSTSFCANPHLGLTTSNGYQLAGVGQTGVERLRHVMTSQTACHTHVSRSEESLEPEKSGNMKYLPKQNEEFLLPEIGTFLKVHELISNYQFSGDVLVFMGLPGGLAAWRVNKLRVSSIRLLWRTSSIRVRHTHADLCQGGSISSIGSIDDKTTM